MSENPDVIVKALVEAGLLINQKDVDKIRSTLATIGEDVNGQVVKSMSSQAAELLKLQARLKRDQARLVEVARGDVDVATLTAGERAKLAQSFNRLKTYQDQLTNMVGSLNKFANAAGKPVFNELSGLNAALEQIKTTTRNVTPFIDQVTEAHKRNAKAAREAATESRRQQRAEEVRRIKADAYDRNREVLEKKNPRGRQAFTEGAPTGFLNITDADTAKLARQYADAELKIRRDIEDLIKDKFGAKSPERRAAAREVDAVAEAYARLGQRLQAVAEIEQLRSKDKRKAEALDKLERDVAANTEARRLSNQRGRDAFLDIGGVGADVSKLKDLNKARSAVSYLKGELSDLQRLERGMADAFGASSQQARYASDEVAKHASLLGALDTRVQELAETADKNKKNLRMQERLDELQERQRVMRLKGQRQFRRFDMALQDPSQLITAKDVRAAISVGDRELGNLQSQQEAIGRVMRANSDEYQNATRRVDQHAEALARLQARLVKLQELESAADGRAKRRASRTALGSLYNQSGRNLYRQNRSHLRSLDDSEQAEVRDYLKRRISEVNAAGNRYSKEFGPQSNQAQAAARSLREYTAALERLGPAANNGSSAISGLGAAFRTFLKYAIVYQALYQIIGAVAALGRSVADLQAQLLDIQAVTGSTGSQMTQLAQVVRSVAADSKFSLEELTEAAKTLAQAGIPIESLNSTLQATANFAAATGTNLETASDIISTTRDVFKDLNDDVIANQLAKAINISKLTGEDLKTILSLGAQTAQSFNMTSEQFLGAVAALRNAGLKSSTVATGLRQAMLEIFTPDAQLTKALQTRYREMGEMMGEEAVRARFFEFTRAENPLVAALTELKRLGFNDEGQIGLSRAFDIRSSNAIKAMIANLKELSANEAKITFGRGAAEGAAVTIEGLNASLTRLYSTITGFTYDRTTGLVGWLTDVANGLDKAINRYDRWERLKDANVNLPDQERENSPFPVGANDKPAWYTRLSMAVGPKQLFDFSLPGLVSKFRPGKEQRDLETGIAGGTSLINEQQLKQEEFEAAAKVWDVNLARTGEAVGTAAAQMVSASEQSALLRATIKNVLGPDMVDQEAALRDLVKGYTSLTESQRSVRRVELRDQNKTLAKITDDGELDRMLFRLEQLTDTVDGTLEAIGEDMSGRIIKARQAIVALEGREPTTPAEIEAAVTLELFKTDQAVQNILNGTSQLTSDMQIGVMEQFAQKLAEQIRSRNGALPAEALARQQVFVLQQQARLLSTTGDISSAVPEIRAQLKAVTVKYRENNDANITYLKTLEKVLIDAAAAADGATSFLLKQATLDLQEVIAGKQRSLIEETAKRVQHGKGVNAALQDPRFRSYVEKMPDTNPEREILMSVMGTQVPDQEFAANGSLAKLLFKSVDLWNTSIVELQNTQKRIGEEVARRTGLQDRAGRAEERFSEAKATNRFGDARAARRDATAAQVAIIDEERKRLDQQIQSNYSRGDQEQNNELIERAAELQAERNRLLNQEARELSRLNQEEAKVNNQRAMGAAKAEQARLEDVLSTVDEDTPVEVIEQTIRDYDANQKELLRLYKERKQLESDNNETARQQIEEEEKKLKAYEDQNAHLEMVLRRERGARERLLAELERPLTTGDTREDAKMRAAGLVPGSRTSRARYLERQGSTLTDLLNNADRQLPAMQDLYEENRVKLKKDRGNKELAAQQATLRQEIRQLTADTDQWREQLGEVAYELGRVKTSFRSAIGAGFDLNLLIAGLEQSENSVENLALKIHESLIAGIEGIGDAFADALLEGTDFFESMDKLFIDTGKQILRDVIKTYTTETITDFLKVLSPSRTLESQQPGAVGSPLGGGLLSMGKSAWDWLTGATPASSLAAGAPAAGEDAGLFGLGKTLFGGDKSAVAGDAAGCCCDDGGGLFGDADKNPANPLGGDILKDTAETEGKGFFASISDGFFGLIDGLKSGFGGMLKGLGGLVGLGGGGGGGAFGMLTSMLFAKGGVIKAATGGVITGPGTGTSDSIPGFIRSKSGKLKPLFVSNNESILTAKATQLLGEDFIHAINSGDIIRSDSGGLDRAVSSLNRAAVPAAAAPAGERVVKEQRNTSLHVTPAMMRMRMGDWLEQHAIEELRQR